MNIKTLSAAFLESGLWASVDKNGKSLDGIIYNKARLPKATEAKIEKHIQSFYDSHKEVCDAAIEIIGENSFAHDLFLNCAGHGAGFWDRNALAVPSGKSNEDGIALSIGEYLDKACESARVESFDIYRGWIYID